MSLVARVQALEDLEEIRQLRFSYHDYLNRDQFERMSALYCDDASVRIDYVAHARGIEEIHAFFLNIPRTLSFIKQFTHNHLVELKGDEASGIAYMDARYASDGQSIMVAGRFDETYSRTSAGWRISETLVTLYFSVPLASGWAGMKLHHIEPHSGFSNHEDPGFGDRATSWTVVKP
jgi:ketosteroid isomerase-like protein